MNEFDKLLIKDLKNVEFNIISTISNERRNLLRLREYLIQLLDSYEKELKDYNYENKLVMSERVIIEIEYIAMLIEISDITYELSTLIDNIKSDKRRYYLVLMILKIN